MNKLHGLEPGYYAISSEDIQQLQDTIFSLRAALASHLANRDAGVTDILSGLEPKWLCLKEIEDHRETLRKVMEGSDSHGKTYTVYEEDVPEDEQLKTIIDWISDSEDLRR